MSTEDALATDVPKLTPTDMIKAELKLREERHELNNE